MMTFHPFHCNIAAIAGGVVGSIIIAGLLLLGIWKVLTVVHDRMEYSRFQRERALARWNRVCFEFKILILSLIQIIQSLRTKTQCTGDP